MAIAGASISFDAFIDDEILFSSKDEVNAFFSNIRVPVATQAAYGSVKQAQTIVFNSVNLVNSDSAVINLDAVNVFEVPSKASFDELKVAFNALQVSHASLVQKLQQAGLMA